MFAAKICAVCSGEWKQHKGLKYLWVLLYCTLVPAVLNKKGVVQWLVQTQWHAGEILNCCIVMVSGTKIKEDYGHHGLCSYSLSSLSGNLQIQSFVSNSQLQVSRECLVPITQASTKWQQWCCNQKWNTQHLDGKVHMGLLRGTPYGWWLAMSRRSLSLSLYHLREVILSFPMLGLDRFNFQAKFPTIQISRFKSYQGTKCLRSIAAGWQITIAHSSENFSTNIESFLVQDPHPRSWLQAHIKSECIFIYSICKYTSFEVCK